MSIIFLQKPELAQLMFVSASRRSRHASFPEDGVKRMAELVKLGWLGQELVGTRLLILINFHGVDGSGINDDRHFFKSPVFSHHLEGFHPIHDRHVDVEENVIR